MIWEWQKNCTTISSTGVSSLLLPPNLHVSHHRCHRRRVQFGIGWMVWFSCVILCLSPCDDDDVSLLLAQMCVYDSMFYTFECVASFRSPDRLYHMHGINVFIVVRFGSACAVPLLLLPYYAKNMSMLPFQYVIIIQWAQHNTHSRITHTNPKKAKAIHQIRRTRARAHTHELPTSLWREKNCQKKQIATRLT